MNREEEKGETIYISVEATSVEEVALVVLFSLQKKQYYPNLIIRRMKGESLGLEPLLCDLIIGFPIEGE